MEEMDVERQDMSGDEVAGEEKMVPVSEAIRYRKRAQTAEKEAYDLQKQLEMAQGENQKLCDDLAGIRLGQQLIEKLSAAGAHDLEAAVVLARDRMKGTEQADIDTVVEQLRSEKGYLFEASEEIAAPKTAGAREKQSGGRRVLEGAAKRAAGSGSRADVQEYLRVRRQFV